MIVSLFSFSSFVLFSLFHFLLGAELGHFSRDQNNNVTSTNLTRKFCVSSIVGASKEKIGVRFSSLGAAECPLHPQERGEWTRMS